MSPLPPNTPAGPDPRLHHCEVDGCGVTAYFGHHDIRGDRIIEHWRCTNHKPEGWPTWPRATGQ